MKLVGYLVSPTHLLSESVG